MPKLLHILKSWQIIFVFECIWHVVESTDLLNATENITLNLNESMQKTLLHIFICLYYRVQVVVFPLLVD